MKRMWHYMVAAAASAGLLLAPTLPARAQDIGPALDMTLMAGWAGGEAVRYDLEKRAAAGSTSKTNSGTRAVKLTYVPTPALQRETVQRLAARLRPGSPTGAQTVADNFRPGKLDYEQLYNGIIKDSGIERNDAAGALATYLMTGYMVVNNIQNGQLITVPMAKGARVQAAAILAQNAKLTALAAVARLGEEMKLQTVVVTLGWAETIKAKTDASYRTNIGQLFKTQYGFDMAQVQLTNQGFVKK